MFTLTEEKLRKLSKIEEWDDSELKELIKNFAEDPIYVWGGKDEKEAFGYLNEKGYKWALGVKLERYDPGLTWGYPIVIFLEKGKQISYVPVDFGKDAIEEPTLD